MIEETEKENLEKLLIIQKKSYEEVGKEYGITGAGIKKAAKRLGIQLDARRAINPNETFGKGTIRVPILACENCGKEFKHYRNLNQKYCSCKCQQEFQRKEKYNKILIGDPSIMRANYSPRNFEDLILEEQEGKCAICGCEPTHNGKLLVFILDHIDGHAANNKRDNLRLICPNCDSQLDTYKSKNKHSDRIYHHYNHR